MDHPLPVHHFGPDARQRPVLGRGTPPRERRSRRGDAQGPGAGRGRGPQEQGSPSPDGGSGGALLAPEGGGLAASSPKQEYRGPPTAAPSGCSARRKVATWLRKSARKMTTRGGRPGASTPMAEFDGPRSLGDWLRSVPSDLAAGRGSCWQSTSG